MASIGLQTNGMSASGREGYNIYAEKAVTGAWPIPYEDICPNFTHLGRNETSLTA